MKPCTKRHARIELDDDLVWSRVVVMPGCFHQHAPSDAMDAVVRLPGICPVLFVAFGDEQIADRAEPTEVPECLPDVVDRSRHDVGRIEEGPYDDRPGRVDGKIVTVRVLGERLLDDHALIETV